MSILKQNTEDLSNMLKICLAVHAYCYTYALYSSPKIENVNTLETMRLIKINGGLGSIRTFHVAYPCAYKTFFVLNSAEHEMSKLDKSNLINLLEKLLIFRDFHCFCISNHSLKFNFLYTLKINDTSTHFHTMTPFDAPGKQAF